MARRKKKKAKVGVKASTIRQVRRASKDLSKYKKRNAKERAKRERDIARGEKVLSRLVQSKITPKAKGRKSSAKLTQLTPEFIFNGYSNYTPQSIKASFGGSPEEQTRAMKLEYSRLRAVAQKRLKRLEKSEFAGSEIFKYYNSQFKKLKDISSDKLPESLVSVNRFLQNPLSTIKGQTNLRNERIEKLRSYVDNDGKIIYDVNVKNFQKVVDVMDELRSMINDKFYDSDQMLQDTITIINNMIMNSEIDWERKSTFEIAEDVFKNYGSNSSKLLSLAIKKR